MNKTIKTRLFGWAMLMLLAGFPALAQETTPAEPIAAERDSYDPLVPQLFAVDNKNNVFAAISLMNNSVDIIHRQDNNMTITSSFLVDVVYKRHDEHFIYRPQSVAIYQDHVVVLATHRDSCYLAVLDFNGKLVNKITLAGRASAFSYSPEARELYIAGTAATNYDVIALDASKGMANIVIGDGAILHYVKPRMSDVIAVKDPFGIGMAVTAMTVVFLALMLLYLIFRQLGIGLSAIQHKRHQKHETVAPKPGAVSPKDNSGEVFAAITAAIHLFNDEMHDEENTILTINKVSRSYSPWSSKLHGLNTYFNKR